MRKAIFALCALSLLGGTTAATAAPCRDKHGKFIKCPAKPKMCRDAKGHFAKCK